jgi:hypothetical protein
MTACSPLCGDCGRCSAAWEREDEDDDIVCEFCTYCTQPMDEDVSTYPYCSSRCAVNASVENDITDSPF